jgi:methionyl aminopeptidase
LILDAGERYCEVLSDEWTVVTKDHSNSAQFENTYLITENGIENLTKRTDKSYKFWWMK